MGKRHNERSLSHRYQDSKAVQELFDVLCYSAAAGIGAIGFGSYLTHLDKGPEELTIPAVGVTALIGLKRVIDRYAEREQQELLTDQASDWYFDDQNNDEIY